MPALAHEIKERLARHGLSPQDIDVLMAIDAGNEVRFDGQRSPGAVAYFEALTEGRNPKTIINWCANLLLLSWLGLPAQRTL
jgi:aspartyl-tRNA(Asn)/glutamyl-tRNA(Gln) amidotransferase subunit B